MRLVDMTLPAAFINVCYRMTPPQNAKENNLMKSTEIGSTVGTMSLVIAAVGYFAASLPLIAGVLYLVQRFYLRTSRQLRLLE